MNHSADSEQEPASSNNPIDIAIRIGLIVLLTFWCLQIAAPFIGPVLWGIIIAIGSYPLYRWLQAKLGLSDGLTATLYTLLLLAILITPTVILTGSLVDQAQDLSKDLQNDTLTIPAPPESVAGWPLIGEKLSAFWTQASLDPKGTPGKIEPQLKKMGKWLIQTAAGAGLGILMLVFSIIIAGVFLATAQGGRRAAETILTRLIGEKGKDMTDLAQATVNSVVNGILGLFVGAVVFVLGYTLFIAWLEDTKAAQQDAQLRAD